MPGAAAFHFFLPDFVCDKSLAATDFCAGVDFELLSCLLAFEATFLLVSLGFFANRITSFRAVLPCSPERDLMQVLTRAGHHVPGFSERPASYKAGRLPFRRLSLPETHELAPQV
ncbi:hypothetical protein ACEZCY_33950 [Streptacidiphilus sp. N1-12]|uniref:Uncharacterized protein n=2 Tax=Streptacidiphilus alkalitolerans TaxID=3342712 RepID=A0ABV6WQ85_9ACTN